MQQPTTGPLVFSLVLASLCGGCGKPRQAGGPGTTAPEGPVPAASANSAALRYSELSAKLVQHAKIDFTTTGGGRYAAVTAELGVDLEFQGSKDVREVRWKIVSVDDVTLSGALESGSDQPTQTLLELGAGVWLADAHGVVDLARTDAHPANAPRKKMLADVDADLASRAGDEPDAVPPPGAALLKLVPGLIELPRLPADPLKVGAPVTSTQSHETRLTGTDIILPVEAKTERTLVNLATSGGIRLAEISFVIDEWGGLDLDSGPVELHNVTKGRMLFDVDRGLPIDLGYTREESLVAGDISYDTTKIVSATFERE